MKKLPFLFLLLVTCAAYGQNQAVLPQPSPRVLPSILKDGRFYLKMTTSTGDTLTGFCDTGGGYTAVYPSVLDRLGRTNRIKAVAIGKDTIRYVEATDILLVDDIPFPAIGNYYKEHIAKPFFELADEKEGDIFLKNIPHDLFLGQFYFIDHAWTFDYLSGKITMDTPIDKNEKNHNIQKAGFKKEGKGKKRFGHPRIQVVVDGKTLDVLFDTGASFLLSDTGKTGTGSGGTSAAGSFIAKSVFDTWHRKHPDWKVIEKGELNGSDLIQVPEVTVGNLTVGPVWFAKRPDEAWTRGMIGSMDKAVKGAVGGSLLQYFRVQIDYAAELVAFEK